VVRDFNAAIELDPSIAEAYANRGLALMLLGTETEAARDLKKRIELKPEEKAEIERRAEIAKRLVHASAAVPEQ